MAVSPDDFHERFGDVVSRVNQEALAQQQEQARAKAAEERQRAEDRASVERLHGLGRNAAELLLTAGIAPDFILIEREGRGRDSKGGVWPFHRHGQAHGEVSGVEIARGWLASRVRTGTGYVDLSSGGPRDAAPGTLMRSFPIWTNYYLLAGRGLARSHHWFARSIQEGDGGGPGLHPGAIAYHDEWHDGRNPAPGEECIEVNPQFERIAANPNRPDTVPIEDEDSIWTHHYPVDKRSLEWIPKVEKDIVTLLQNNRVI